jgi:2,4-dienoyl-CoA reductase-like NADH-dependent reductase (Old Yellow Enzyme family)
MINQIKIKKFIINSPFFFAPINTGLAKDGSPTNELISFHSKKSNNYTGINYVGNIAISKLHTTNNNTLYINENMNNYEKLVSSIKNHGSIAGAQIAAYNSKFTPQNKWINKNTDKYLSILSQEVSSYSYNDIKTLIDFFVEGILKLYNVGFEAIQLHAAHGYLLNSFISDTFNKRNDEFGKDRLLIIKEIISKIDHIKKDIILDIRISLFEDSFLEALSSRHTQSLNRLYNYPDMDIISISNGIYNIDKTLIYPPKIKGINFLIPILKEYLFDKDKKIWNISGNIRNLDELPLKLKNFTYSIGRPILADNDFLPKFFKNRSSINNCLYCNKCHYYSRKADFISCKVNSSIF